MPFHSPPMRSEGALLRLWLIYWCVSYKLCGFSVKYAIFRSLFKFSL